MRHIAIGKVLLAISALVYPGTALVDPPLILSWFSIAKPRNSPRS